MQLVANNAADRGTTHGTNGTAAREGGTADSTDAGADRRIPVPSRHPGAAVQAKQRYHGQGTDGKSSYRFHWNTSRQ
jgi:hypothetical protein